MTHKTKDCVERPRKKGAKVTGKDIKPDEYIRDINLTFEAKRDRWNGYVRRNGGVVVFSSDFSLITIFYTVYP